MKTLKDLRATRKMIMATGKVPIRMVDIFAKEYDDELIKSYKMAEMISNIGSKFETDNSNELNKVTEFLDSFKGDNIDMMDSIVESTYTKFIIDKLLSKELFHKIVGMSTPLLAKDISAKEMVEEMRDKNHPAIMLQRLGSIFGTMISAMIHPEANEMITDYDVYEFVKALESYNPEFIEHETVGNDGNKLSIKLPISALMEDTLNADLLLTYMILKMRHAVPILDLSEKVVNEILDIKEIKKWIE